MRILLLGGSTEASLFARALAEDARFTAVLSLAGRTAAPRSYPIPVRIGGFGGVEGLVRYLRDESVQALIDATHPFASQMSKHAIEAASAMGIPILAIERPPWQRQKADNWIEVSDIASGVKALGQTPRAVFCAIGGLALRELQAAPHHFYVIRLIERHGDGVDLPSFRIVQARGPFTAEDDIRLFREHGIEIVLAKNSGGSATISKIEAARALNLPVVLIARPPIPQRPTVATAAEAMNCLVRHYEGSRARGV